MSKEPISKVYLILEKIDYIEQIVQNTGSITVALEDYITSRLSIILNIINNIQNKASLSKNCTYF